MALSNDTILFVGLGNPGEKHKNNRHNVGFMALDCLSAFHKFGRSRTKFLGRTAMGSLDDRKLISFKPQTFMNESGRAVREASNFYKIGPERIIVFHDELDLPFGQVRVKKGGGHAGHNGLKSIDENIGTDYFRIRIGISHPGEKEKVTGHVLGDLSKEDAETLQKILTSIAENISTLIEGDEKKFQKNILQFKK
ncbi:MAG: peptidyl-tRNA hydrolase [Candidatus Dadabacteria bacterium]|nr:aminoacyl-tRNA hydrolase [Pseudomonadota bacterium]MEC8797196.1 aminoacyl-tRNA hydrolase [Pseudomonadota bacterium]GIS06505.1 MAG: peptidyl-tRNA hydrolase [Candidatus Dadabacteria bacterium]